MKEQRVTVAYAECNGKSIRHEVVLSDEIPYGGIIWTAHGFERDPFPPSMGVDALPPRPGSARRVNVENGECRG